MVTASIKAPASPEAGTKKTEADKKGLNDTAQGNLTTAEKAAKAAYDIKETLLTAFCVQSIAMGVGLAEMKTGKEVTDSIQFGVGGGTKDKNNANVQYYIDNPPKRDVTMGGSTGGSPQLGLQLVNGSSDNVYRCLIPTRVGKAVAGKIENEPTALATGITVYAPGTATINSARLVDCVNNPLLAKIQTTCEAWKNTHCKWNAGTSLCEEDADKFKLQPRKAFLDAIVAARAKADPQCTATTGTSDTKVYAN
jgi:hypothetical protein